jgi:hypothetical protein
MKPSPAQLKALQRMTAADGLIYRLPGGFWISGTVELKNGAPVSSLEQSCSDVWCDVRTVRALEKNGFVERTNTFAEEWRDTRRVTAAGRSVL